MVTSCASPGVPPGGPVDTAAPQVLRIAPDSGRTGTSPRAVIFQFDEVVSERPANVPTIESLVLISPRDGAPRVDWGRDEISVRPRRNWRPNTTYTVTLLPGLSDLRGNTRNTGASTIFSTGPVLARSQISGVVFNWAEGTVMQRGYVEAVALPDTTLVYATTADSTGTFVIGNLPPGTYRVRAVADANNNRGLDPREAWDSVNITLTDSARTELLAFVHDSVGSRLESVMQVDSLTLRLTFDNPLSATPPLAVANIQVRGADSVAVTIQSVAPPPMDTTVTTTVRRPSRPIPPRTFLARLARPLTPGTYRVRVVDVRNLLGVVRSSERVLTVARPPAVPPAGATPATAPPPAPPPAPVRR
ncbi:MAG TPA: Ig-like domain-containing protein [Gemmatimonadaceae bacterium]|nr:Ig-like domain-containing protein [Gemmatimonadaceae bacterium]